MMWPFRKKKDDRKLFKGVDLNEYHYLGYSDPYFYSAELNSKTVECFIHFFVSKEDEKKRVIKKEIYPPQRQDHMNAHAFVKRAEIWSIGDGPIYQHILYPSDYLKDLMYQEKYIWAGEGKWVQESSKERQKYNDALKEQKNKENNVVKLELIKKDENNT